MGGPSGSPGKSQRKAGAKSVVLGQNGTFWGPSPPATPIFARDKGPDVSSPKALAIAAQAEPRPFFLRSTQIRPLFSFSPLFPPNFSQVFPALPGRPVPPRPFLPSHEAQSARDGENRPRFLGAPGRWRPNALDVTGARRRRFFPPGLSPRRGTRSRFPPRCQKPPGEPGVTRDIAGAGRRRFLCRG